MFLTILGWYWLSDFKMPETSRFILSELAIGCFNIPKKSLLFIILARSVSVYIPSSKHANSSWNKDPLMLSIGCTEENKTCWLDNRIYLLLISVSLVFFSNPHACKLRELKLYLLNPTS